LKIDHRTHVVAPDTTAGLPMRLLRDLRRTRLTVR